LAIGVETQIPLNLIVKSRLKRIKEKLEDFY
jgi:hypothetical protein